MKILHALTFYLAVKALPFYPFASAHPLAASIDYDGYVNTTQNLTDGALMKHFLGNIVETCQTVTTHSDCALLKRVPENIIEARQFDDIPITVAIIAIVGSYILTLFWMLDDMPKRETFTQGTISKVFSQYPNFNWVICHSPYSIAFDGAEDRDWGYTHHVLTISFGRKVGYDLYWARSGTFYRHGDGGFINWAYNGNILRTDDNGATVHFGTIS